ncbi:MAG: hypothetical protein RR931_04680, partial [Mucinivorans sp.]
MRKTLAVDWVSLFSVTISFELLQVSPLLKLIPFLNPSIISSVIIPSTTAIYSFVICFFGDKISWAKAPSSVISTKPVVSLSSLPAGKRFFLISSFG